MTEALLEAVAEPPALTDIPPGTTGILTVDLGAIVANWRRLQRRVGAGCIVAATVKADAYGLGLAPVALARWHAAGCRWFFVATLEEGATRSLSLLRIGCIDAWVGSPSWPGRFAGQRPRHRRPDSGAWFLCSTIWGRSPRLAHQVPRTGKPGHAASRHRHVAPGTSNRSRRSASPRNRQRIWTGSPVPLVAVMSHLACADAPAHPMNAASGGDFEALAPAPAAGAAQPRRQLYGIFLGAAYHYDMVRPGAALYGLNPLPNNPNPMSQVIGLKARILQVREIDAGRSVGYGARYTADRKHRVATLGVGYADGILRSAGNRCAASISALSRFPSSAAFQWI